MGICSNPASSMRVMDVLYYGYPFEFFCLAPPSYQFPVIHLCALPACLHIFHYIQPLTFSSFDSGYQILNLLDVTT